jgi:pimeloyl-ACP methyl ester carboxylesterase
VYPETQATVRWVLDRGTASVRGSERLARDARRLSPELPIDADILRVPAGPGALHVERYGQGGEPFVLLHGFATSSFLWRNIAPALAAGGHTAFAVDLMGYGESDRPPECDYSIGAQTEYLDRAMTGLRLTRATLVGLDVGGGVAQRLAVLNPARVTRLVLVNSVGLDECPGKDVRTVQRGTARFAFAVSRGVLGAAPLLRRVLEGSVVDPGRMPPRLLARYLAPYVGADGVSHLLTLARALRSEDVEQLDLASITAPTQIVWGEADRWFDSGLPERLQQAIPGSQLIRLAGVSRLVPEEAPDTLSRILLEWAAAVEAPESDTIEA